MQPASAASPRTGWTGWVGWSGGWSPSVDWLDWLVDGLDWLGGIVIEPYRHHVASPPPTWKLEARDEERMRRPISGVPFLFCFAGVSPSALDGTADVVKRIASSPQQQAADNPNQPKHRKQQPRQPKAMKGEKRSPQQTPAADSAATKRPSKGPQDQHQRSRPQEGKRPRPTELQRTSAARAIEDETATIPTPRQPQPAGPHTASTRSSPRLADVSTNPDHTFPPEFWKLSGTSAPMRTELQQRCRGGFATRARAALRAVTMRGQGDMRNETVARCVAVVVLLSSLSPFALSARLSPPMRGF